MLHCSMFRGYSSPSKVSTNRTENTSRPFWLLKSTIKRSCFQLGVMTQCASQDLSYLTLDPSSSRMYMHNPLALSVEKSDKTNNSTETLVNPNQSSGCILMRGIHPRWSNSTGCCAPTIVMISPWRICCGVRPPWGDLGKTKISLGVLLAETTRFSWNSTALLG